MGGREWEGWVSRLGYTRRFNNDQRDYMGGGEELRGRRDKRGNGDERQRGGKGRQKRGWRGKGNGDKDLKTGWNYRQEREGKRIKMRG